jgi:hypothetical protein
VATAQLPVSGADRLKILVSILVVLAILAVTILILNRPRMVTIDSEIPDGFPSDGFAHSVFERLLQTYVNESGKVDYDRWQSNTEDRRSLDSYLAAVSRFSPASSPERFQSRQDELSYWLYAYNAYVIRTILQHWPLDSVTNIKAPVEIVKGLGFFYRLRFEFGGRSYSLYAVENDIVRQRFRDARIHFVLNCASESCPVLRPELPTGDALEPFLQQSAMDFVRDRRNVCVDHDKKEIVLSAIFKWFRSDFINDLRRRGLPTDRGVVDYVASVAPVSLTSELAGANDYDVVFSDYDWAVNSQE